LLEDMFFPNTQRETHNSVRSFPSEPGRV